MSPYGAPERTVEGVPARARKLALQLIRKWGLATSRWRATPDYLIIGTKRGGSTSLAKWVLDHPQVRPLFPARETRKGTYFYDTNFHRGVAWYRSHFPTRFALSVQKKRAGKQILVGEATPYYLFHPHAPTRAYADAPNAKVIALLRHPADRAFGHWGERTRNNVEWLSFEDALHAEEERAAGEEAKIISDPTYNSFSHQHFSYVDQSRYDRGVKRWMDAWPEDQLLILRSEDLYENPGDTLDRVFEFLGLDPFRPAEFVVWNKKATSSVPADLEKYVMDQTAESVAELERILGISMNWERRT